MTRHSVPVFRIALASLVLASGFGIALYITTRAWRPTLGLIGFLTVMFTLIVSISIWWEERRGR